MKRPALRAGDSIYTGGKSRVARLIAWFTRGAYEPPTKATHAASAYSSDLVEEAVSPKVHRIPADQFWDQLEKGGYYWVIMRRRVEPKEQEIDRLRKYLDEMLGTIYAFLEFIPQGMDGLIMKVFPRAPPIFRHLNDLLPNIQCSGLVSRAEIAAGWADPITRFDSPDDSLDRKLKDPAWYVAATNDGEMLHTVAMFFMRKMLNIQGGQRC